MFGWLGLTAVVGVQIAYPLVSGGTRAGLVVVTVALGWLLSVGHAWATRGWRVAAILVAVSTGGGLAVEAVGVRTGFPFGSYAYGDALGATLLGVPLVIPLAWTWMAWPAWLAAAALTSHPLTRIGLAGLGLATWDLFLDPQMVAERYWRWSQPSPALPGVGEVPVGNYLGWLAVALAMMGVLSLATSATATRTSASASASVRVRVVGGGMGIAVAQADLDSGRPHRGQPALDRRRSDLDWRRDGPMLALYLWTYYSSVLAHAVFLRLPASAWWGGLGMGLVAIPLTARLLRR